MAYGVSNRAARQVVRELKRFLEEVGQSSPKRGGGWAKP
jgi:hypothetical protein